MSESHHPQRIACLQPSGTVILAAVGELGRVVACTKYCQDVAPELRSGNRLISIIADSWTSKSSEILAAKPDLVIASVPYQRAAVEEILKSGISFLGLAPHTLNDIYTDIALIAGAVGASDRGEQVIAKCRLHRRSKTPDREPPPQASLLRRVGKAHHRLATVGRRNSRGRGRQFLGNPGANARRKRSLD